MLSWGQPKVARVKYPDGVYKTFEVNHRDKASVLFDQAVTGISLDEQKYFSLCFYDTFDGTRYWMRNDTRILQQLRYPDQKRTQDRRYKGQPNTIGYIPHELPWNFSLEMKFYPPSPSTLVDDLARYYVFMQLKQDALTGLLKTTINDFTLLGALLVQLRFGDAQITMGCEFREFVASLNLDLSIDSAIQAKIIDQHKKLVGVTTTKAMNRFMHICAGLPTYGLQFFAAKDRNQRKVDIGIGTFGIKIFRNGVVIYTYPQNSFRLFIDKEKVFITDVVRQYNGSADHIFELESHEIHSGLLYKLYHSINDFFRI